MAIRYFNIRNKPDAGGSAIRVDTENPLNKTIEDISSNYYFNKIKEDKNYAHFDLFEGDDVVIRDNSGDSNIIGATPVIMKRGSNKSLSKVCVDNLGNIKFYENNKKLLLQEISRSTAYNIRGDAINWNLLRSWV